MDRIATALKVLGHPERLRILALLSRGELTVSELVQILDVSQPRITQYIKSLESAGIIERLKEGSWVFSRLRHGQEDISALVATTLAALPEDDRILSLDLKRLNEVRKSRARSVDNFFDDVANDRGQLGDEYLPRENIDQAMRDMVGSGPFTHMVDLGTGTGRVLNIFSDHIKRGTGIDNNAAMLRVARHKLSGRDKAHMSVRQGELTATPLEDHCADLVTLHQVLHYLHDPKLALEEAHRILSDQGQILIVDFEAHDRDEFREKYAHRRLGFSDGDIKNWMNEVGFELINSRIIKTEHELPNVKLWQAGKVQAPQRVRA